MILGMTPFTFVHVLLSLVGIVTGFVVLYGFVAGWRKEGWTEVFLLSTLATSVTGFLFPFHGFTPAIGVGLVSVAILAVALAALYVYRLAGRWRGAFALASVAALYLNVFVLVVQAFQKLPALHALAPTGSEPPFAVVQGIVLVFFVTAGFLSVRRFRPLAIR